MKTIQIHPQAGAPWCKDQQFIGFDLTEDAVFEDLRDATLRDGGVLVPETNHCTFEEFREEFEKGRFDRSLVKFLSLDPITKTIHIPARGPIKSQLVRASDGKVVGTHELPEQPATTKEIVVDRYFDCGNTKNAKLIAARVTEDTKWVVFWEPDFYVGQLDCLPELKKACPHVNILIVHQPSDKLGVVVECDDDPASTWDTQSEVESEQDLPPLVQGIAHEGESTWVGGLPKVGKTWVMLCILLALLTGMPLFGDERLTIPNKAKRCIYLCPEAGRGSIKKRLKMLGLIKHLYDAITNPDGALYLQTLSKGKKIALTDPALLTLAKGADVFIDTAVRYLEGDENSVKDVRVLTENILNLLAVGARSVWVAHHAPKGFENASSMSLQNMFRGSGEFGAALTNAYGVCTEDEATTKVRFHPIVGRDLDELIPDMILQGRPYLFETGNFKVVDANAEKFRGKGGAPVDSLKQEKIEFARSLEGSLQDKADAVNEKFASNHTKSTIHEWLKAFDTDKGAK
jgi:hypothetical protein